MSSQPSKKNGPSPVLLRIDERHVTRSSLLRRLCRLFSDAIRLPLHVAAIARASEAVAAREPTVNVSAPTVNLPPPVVNVAAPVVSVQPPAPPQNVWQDIPPNSDLALFKALSDSALSRTVAIIEAEMAEAAIYIDYASFLRSCLEKAGRTGAHCEFGVFSGATINMLADARPDVEFDGFDSFRGLPSEWAGYLQYDFNRGDVMPEVRPNVRLHAGWFDDTLPGYAEAVDGVAFLHVDCDLYSSTATVFRLLGPKLLPGCVIVFDEYFCYPGFEQHERRAFAEFLHVSGRKARWIACCGQRAACVLE